MNPKIKKYLSAIGAKGGAAGTGTVKARTRKQCQHAVQVREEKRNKLKKSKKKT